MRLLLVLGILHSFLEAKVPLSGYLHISSVLSVCLLLCTCPLSAMITAYSISKMYFPSLGTDIMYYSWSWAYSAPNVRATNGHSEAVKTYLILKYMLESLRKFLSTWVE